MATIIDGKSVAEKMRQSLKEEISKYTNAGFPPPILVIISIGEDAASQVYVRNKIKACKEVGVNVKHMGFSEDVLEDDIKSLIRACNKDASIDGIMVQLPLPKQFNEREIIDTINPKKDVDGLTTTNIGRLRSGQKCIEPCTARGIIDLLDAYHVDIDGKDVTIIGRSNIVGKPLADMLMARGATVTQCHSHTKDISFHTVGADIIISAVGKAKFINHREIGRQQIIIDVGINRDENGKLCGDVDFADVVDRCDLITPTPGGVGPMTVAELLKNTVEIYKNEKH